MKNQSTQISLSESDQNLLKSLHFLESGSPIILDYEGKDLAALISMEDLQLLQRLVEKEEDRIDRAELKQISLESKEQGTISWESLKAELEL